MSRRAMEALWRADDAGGAARLASPGVGWFRPALRIGAVVQPGDALGLLEVLGLAHPVLAPAGTRGQVRGLGDAARAAFPVGHGDLLYAVDPEAASASPPAASTVGAAQAEAGLVFRAPTSGRFYRRAAPGKPPFVEVGAELGPGSTVCLLEVMKTFNRITYGGEALPARARVVELLVGDGDDVDAGAALLRLEPL